MACGRNCTQQDPYTTDTSICRTKNHHWIQQPKGQPQNTCSGPTWSSSEVACLLQKLVEIWEHQWKCFSSKASWWKIQLFFIWLSGKVPCGLCQAVCPGVHGEVHCLWWSLWCISCVVFAWWGSCILCCCKLCRWCQNSKEWLGSLCLWKMESSQISEKFHWYGTTGQEHGPAFCKWKRASCRTKRLGNKR